MRTKKDEQEIMLMVTVEIAAQGLLLLPERTSNKNKQLVLEFLWA